MVNGTVPNSDLRPSLFIGFHRKRLSDGIAALNPRDWAHPAVHDKAECLVAQLDHRAGVEADRRDPIQVLPNDIFEWTEGDVGLLLDRRCIGDAWINLQSDKPRPQNQLAEIPPGSAIHLEQNPLPRLVAHIRIQTTNARHSDRAEREGVSLSHSSGVALWPPGQSWPVQLTRMGGRYPPPLFFPPIDGPASAEHGRRPPRECTLLPSWRREPSDSGRGRGRKRDKASQLSRPCHPSRVLFVWVACCVCHKSAKGEREWPAFGG